jgi:D-amino-acid dehydrogenase
MRSAGQTVVVIGSGIAGASTAFALARRGVRVVIVDDGSPGQATAASAGIILPWATATDGTYYQLYADGAAFYPELLERLADAGVAKTDYRRTGGLIVNADPGLLDTSYQRVLERRQSAGAVVGDVERIDNASAKQLFPPLADGLDAIFISGGGRVDGRTLRDGLLEASTRLGALRRSGHAVIINSAGRAEVRVDDEPLGADAVVAAGGAWTAALLNDVGCAVPVEPQRGQITHLRVAADTSLWPTVHPISHHYLVAFDDSRVVAGATRETGSGFDVRVTAAGQLQVLQDALSIAPGLADATVIETRVGLRPRAEDLPIAGRIPELSNLFVATGYGPAGLTMGPRIGDALARMIINEDAPEIAGIAPTRRSDRDSESV